MTPGTEPELDYTIRLQDGTVLEGRDPVVVLGPNGSGKTRQTRELGVSVPIEFVNALRNTRVSPQIPAMGFGDARNNFLSQRNQARSQHWELSSDFDFLLSQLLAQDAMVATKYMRDTRANTAEALPAETALLQVEGIWGDVFPGRELFWKDWAPHVRSVTTGETVEYSANQMSDGEKAALYLAGRVFSADAGVIVVDEPETHLHSLLAVRLWNALERERPDLRFVYVTHDLTFALSRETAHDVLASPLSGLRALDLGGTLPGDVAEILLGSASLSFYARRVVFCEGNESSLDGELFNAWFHGQDTVVRPVGSCEMVMRCAEALANSGVANSLKSVGLIDRDVHPDEFLTALPAHVVALDVHEVESLLCHPGMVRAVAKHLGKSFDENEYRAALGDSIDAEGRQRLAIQRWKRSMEPKLEGLVSSVSTRHVSLEDLVSEMPGLFDHTKWSFSPEAILQQEKALVESALPGGPIDEILRVAPGKPLLDIAAAQVAMKRSAYVDLIITALRAPDDNALSGLNGELVEALTPLLPVRSL